MARCVAAGVLIGLSAVVFAQEPAKPAPEQKEPAKPPAEAVLSIEKSTKPPPCIIRPVMTDDELRACGARIPK
jgi:hypothetical protein